MGKKLMFRFFYVFIFVFLFTFSCRHMNRLPQTLEKKSSPENRKVENKKPEKIEYPVHHNIKATLFYIGQKDITRSGVLDNGSSAWTSDWVGAYGGIDYPFKRNGHFPKGFIPEENPFYVALPYNDVTFYGHKKNAKEIIPWAKDYSYNNSDRFTSYCKNRWVKIIYQDKTCYAQWEDVGPFETNDWEYVFGTEKPKNNRNGKVGIDVSPAVFHYLGMKDNDIVSWQFVDFKDVPEGPWLRIITISHPNW